MNTAARHEDTAAAVVAGLGLLALFAALVYVALALSLVAAVILIVRRRLGQPKTRWSQLAAIAAGFVVVFTVYFLITAPGTVLVAGI